jgi:uncharacterized protein (DUF2336 family)
MTVDRYRELERPQAMRRKDVVLMATVTSFEDLPHPTKSELRQFAELFSPLFSASSEEARRQAVASLSQSRNVPPAVAFFIACQPIAIAAPFLVASPCLDDETLVTIARTQGEEHARTIVKRDNLSPAVIDALVGLRQSRSPAERPVETTAAIEHTGSHTVEPPALQADAQADREEALRSRLKQMAAQHHRPHTDRLGLRTITAVQEALLVRFARTREADAFATTLSDALSASRWLAERIMLDISGHQLGTTLKGIGMSRREALFVLERFYGHLREAIGDETRGAILWAQLDEDACIRRVDAWRRADHYTYADPASGTANASQAQGLRTTATHRPLKIARGGR